MGHGRGINAVAGANVPCRRPAIRPPNKSHAAERHG